MTNTTQGALARAIESLGAVEVAADLYALPCKTRHGNILSWETLSGTSLRAYFLYLTTNEGKQRGHISMRTRMPAWWSPESRFAQRCDLSGALSCPPETACESTHTRITADLETGQEVPA